MGLLAAAAQADLPGLLLPSAHLRSCPSHFEQSAFAQADAASYSHHTLALTCRYLVHCFSETAAAAASATADKAAIGSRLIRDRCCYCLVVQPSRQALQLWQLSASSGVCGGVRTVARL